LRHGTAFGIVNAVTAQTLPCESADSPVFVDYSGKIVTIETVPLKLPKKHWRSVQVNPDQTYFTDDYLRHVLYITRIYFRYGETESELIGKLVLWFPVTKTQT
jgi:hypothetical protein